MVKKSENLDNQQDKTNGMEEEVTGQQVSGEAGEGADWKEEEEEETEVEQSEPTPEEKLAELQDRYLRLSAEFDNYRKRTLKEKIELQKNANMELLSALLPVADDFDRALQSVNEAKDIQAVKEGMKLISGKFQSFLNQHGVKEIDAKNKTFDTDLHEAITKVPAPEKKLRGKVVDVIQKGYFLNDKVLRFSKVVIGE
ncbi:MAG TPA: nucleotide exchange factor GrpE [Bacteroides sp.]|nr:nucleotide exchange factor GrpE [Bacteroides sp.]